MSIVELDDVLADDVPSWVGGPNQNVPIRIGRTPGLVPMPATVRGIPTGAAPLATHVVNAVPLHRHRACIVAP
jgi:hypothetical protein